MRRFLRFRFPGNVADTGYPSPETRARAMAAVFLSLPRQDLTIGALESAAVLMTDRGVLEWTQGEPIGEQLAPWLWLVVAPLGRRAYLDCDPEAMGRQLVTTS